MSYSQVKRIDNLSILFEEMHHNLLNFDMLHNPINNPSADDSYTDGCVLQKELLILMENVENLITTFIITDDCLFELNLVEIEQNGVYGLAKRKIEIDFFKINHIFKTSNLKSDHQFGGANSFSSKIQYSLDIELFLDFFGKRIHFCKILTSRNNRGLKMIDLQKRALISDLAKEKKPEFMEVLPSFSDEISSDFPLLKDRQKLFTTSLHFIAQLQSKEHRSKLNVVNSNVSARHKKATAYIDGLFDYHKRLTFVALDLCFDQETNVDNKKDIFSRFKNGMRKHPLLKEMVGYIGKWEFSFLKSTYIRMIFIFPLLSDYAQEQIVEIIGSYWKYHSIFEDKVGTFHSAKLASYPPQLDQTICSISQSQKQLRTEFEKRTIFYLTNAQDHYRSKQNELKEFFFKGTLKHTRIDQ